MGNDKRRKTCPWGNGMQMFFCIPSGGRNGVAYENDRNREIDRYADGTGDASQTPLGENLLVALEMYRIEEEKAINHLADILTAYGIDVSAEEIRTTETETLKTTVREKVEVR